MSRVSCAYGDYEEPPQTILRNAQATRDLDLTGNNFSDVAFLAPFVNLESLVLDGNLISSQTKFPILPKLHTLWLNKNEITNLSYFIDSLASTCPNIKYLSMLNNKACPNYFNGGTVQQYHDYRIFVVSRFKQLVALDDSKVSQEEREESFKIYGAFRAQSLFNDPGRLGARVKKKKVRVKTNFSEKEREADAEEKAPIAPQNDPTTISVGPGTEPNPSSSSTPVIPVASVLAKVLKEEDSDEASSSDWSTDSGDMATPFLVKRHRSPSHLKSEVTIDPEEKSAAEKKVELLGMLRTLKSSKAAHEIARETEFDGGSSEEHNFENESHEGSHQDAEEGTHPEEEEEGEEESKPQKKKKKRPSDLLQQELQARLKIRTHPEAEPESQAAEESN